MQDNDAYLGKYFWSLKHCYFHLVKPIINSHKEFRMTSLSWNKCFAKWYSWVLVILVINIRETIPFNFDLLLGHLIDNLPKCPKAERTNNNLKNMNISNSSDWNGWSVYISPNFFSGKSGWRKDISGLWVTLVFISASPFLFALVCHRLVEVKHYLFPVWC